MGEHQKIKTGVLYNQSSEAPEHQLYPASVEIGVATSYQALQSCVSHRKNYMHSIIKYKIKKLKQL